ncbi:putative deoxyribonuclease TATDN2 [Patiria miniata]|uniref:Uncharacterized protein n=1 Tax=Patiria miniata TaxID=46514 RepID=A0A914AB80_PATMI|nr:putative deoxyribonuclease TATDN2 [Patiria miniata]
MIETTNFRGCIANFYDEGTLTDERRWAELVDDHFVAAAVGFHPKQAQRFTQDTDRVIRRLLDHPKTCALGEIGLDYSGEHGRWRAAQIWCGKFPNLCVGLTSMVTWDVAEPREVARKIPLERLLLETDAPYFLPRGLTHIGYSNPTMARLVAREVAQIRGDREEDVLKQCLQNTRRLYGVNF